MGEGVGQPDGCKGFGTEDLNEPATIVAETSGAQELYVTERDVDDLHPSLVYPLFGSVAAGCTAFVAYM